jgi:hypothetical protein
VDIAAGSIAARPAGHIGLLAASGHAWRLTLPENVAIYAGIPAVIIAAIAAVVFGLVRRTGSVDSRSIRVARLEGPRIRREPVLGRPTDPDQLAGGSLSAWQRSDEPAPEAPADAATTETSGVGKAADQPGANPDGIGGSSENSEAEADAEAHGPGLG